MQEATVASLAMRGRGAALDTLTDQLDRVRSGVGAVVLVEGVPGIGKSRLLAEAATLAGGMSFRVGAGAAQPGAVVELAAALAGVFAGGRCGGARSRYWTDRDFSLRTQYPSNVIGCCRTFRRCSSKPL